MNVNVHVHGDGGMLLVGAARGMRGSSAMQAAAASSKQEKVVCGLRGGLKVRRDFSREARTHKGKTMHTALNSEPSNIRAGGTHWQAGRHV